MKLTKWHVAATVAIAAGAVLAGALPAQAVGNNQASYKATCSPDQTVWYGISGGGPIHAFWNAIPSGSGSILVHEWTSPTAGSTVIHTASRTAEGTIYVTNGYVYADGSYMDCIG